LGDVKKVGEKEVVQWKSTKNTQRTLNARSLKPDLAAAAEEPNLLP
jgi:hypothetical protein